MFVTTLLCSPTDRNLDAALVESLRNAWGGGEVLWLSPDETAEFNLPVVPGNFWAIWEDLQNLGVDIAIQTAADRKKKVLLADMDSTIIQQECVDELADVAGVGDRVAEITAKAMNGELNFESSLIERVQLLKGLDSSVIDTVLADRITLMPGAEILVATMKENGGYAALVSGGFTVFTSRIAERLGFNENRANTLLIEDGKLTGKVAMPILGRDAKVAALSEIAEKLGTTPDQVLAVGDGSNDLGMLHLAGTGVALHAKPSVAAQCNIRINFGDLTALLYLQGYTKEEFVI